MASNHSGFPDFGNILGLFGTLLGIIVNLYSLIPPGKRLKVFEGISYCGLVATGLALGFVSVDGQIGIYNYTSIVWPLNVLNSASVEHLPSQEATVFGNFANFFGFSLIAGGISVFLGIIGIRSLLKKQNLNYSCYQ